MGSPQMWHGGLPRAIALRCRSRLVVLRLGVATCTPVVDAQARSFRAGLARYAT